MQYNINGHIIDMSTVEVALKEGDLVDASVALEQILKTLPGVDVQRWWAIFFDRMGETGQIPTQEEMAEVFEIQTPIVPKRKMQLDEKFAQGNSPGVPSCPTCHSTRLTKLSAGTRFIDRMFFGAFSPEAKAQFRCMDCGYMF